MYIIQEEHYKKKKFHEADDEILRLINRLNKMIRFKRKNPSAAVQVNHMANWDF